MSNIGFATLSVIPSLRGTAASLSGQMSGPAASAGASAGGVFGGRFGGALRAAVPLAVVAGLGAAAVSLGNNFKGAYNTIRAGTGETGAALEDLNASFRNVLRQTPAGFDDVAAAITGVNQRLDLTGAPLEATALGIVRLSRVTGTDLNQAIESSTTLFNRWHVSAAEQVPLLDQLFRAGQETGVGVAELSENLTRSGPALQELGFGLDASIAMLAGFQEQGVNVTAVTTAMRTGLKNFAADGEAPAEAFGRFVDGVKDGTVTLDDAFQVFGARGGLELFNAIKDGNLDLEALTATIAGGSDTLQDAGADMSTLAGKWGLLKNQLAVAFEPVAMRSLDLLNEALKAVMPWVDKLTLALANPALVDGLTVFGGLLAGAAAISALGAALAAVVGFISLPVLALVALGAAAVYAYTHFEDFRDVVDGVVDWLVGTAWPAIQEGAASFVEWAIGTAWPAIQGFAEDVGEIFGDLVEWTRQHWGQISEAVGHVATVLATIVGGVIAFMTFAWRTWGDDMLHIAQAAWGFISDTIANVVRGLGLLIEIGMAVINGDWALAWDKVKEYLSTVVWPQIWNILTTGWAVLQSIMGASMSILRLLWDLGWMLMGAALSAAWDKFMETLKEKGAGIVLYTATLPNRIFLALVPAINSLMFKVGSSAMDWLRDGMAGGFKRVVGWVGGIGGQIRGAIGDLAKTLYSIGRSVISGFLSGMMSTWASDVVGWLSSRAEDITDRKGPLDKDRSLLIPAGRAIMEGLDVGLRGGWKDVAATLGAMAPAMATAAMTSPGEFSRVTGMAPTSATVAHTAGAAGPDADLDAAFGRAFDKRFRPAGPDELYVFASKGGHRRETGQRANRR